MKSKKMMKTKERKAYRAPECQLVPVETTYLMQTSFPSQHRPGHHGTGPASAKGMMNWEEEEEENSSSDQNALPWED